MSPLPDNVVVLADRRPVEMPPVPPPALPHLRLVHDGEPSTPFGLDVFLARAQLVMAETDPDDGDVPAVVFPLHARQA